MSTDALETPLLAAPEVTYGHRRHLNSNNSRRRGLCGLVFNPKTGEKEFKSHTTYQVVKHPEGEPLPHRPFLMKRNKYVPHVGAKQLAKLS